MVEVPCQVVEGHVKGADYNPGDPCDGSSLCSHAWNGVFLHGCWRLVDCSWAAGHVTGTRHRFQFRLDDHYFCSSPERFILDHYPADPKWQLLSRPVKLQQYQNGPCIHSGYFRLGVIGCNLTSGQIKVTDTTQITLKLSRPILVTFNLQDLQSGHTYSACVTVENSRTEPNVTVHFPHSGKFLLVIYGMEYDSHPEPTRLVSATCHASVMQAVTSPLQNGGFPWGPTAAFSESGIKLVRNTNFFNNIYGSDCELQFEHKMAVLHAVSDPSGRVMCNRNGDVTSVCVRPSEHGYMRVAVYIMQNGSKRMVLACTVLLSCHALLQLRPNFPHTTARWLQHRCSLHQPTENPLVRNTSTTFHLDIPGAVLVVIIQGRSLNKLSQIDELTWKGKYKVSGDCETLRISTRFETSDKFYRMLQYDVI